MPTEDSETIKTLILQLEKLQVQERDTLATLEAEIKKKEKKEDKDTQESFRVGDRVRIRYPRSLNPFSETEDSISPIFGPVDLIPTLDHHSPNSFLILSS